VAGFRVWRGIGERDWERMPWVEEEMEGGNRKIGKGCGELERCDDLNLMRMEQLQVASVWKISRIYSEK
jgi:hypothetical protein